MPRPRNGIAAAESLAVTDALSLRERLDLTIAGDRASLGALFVLYGDMVYGVSRRYTTCSADALATYFAAFLDDQADGGWVWAAV